MWTKIKAIIQDGAPLLASMLGGRLGETAYTMIASALGVKDSEDQIYRALQEDPGALERIRHTELENTTELRKLLLENERNKVEADTQRLLAVNSTMRAESVSEHWMQWSWRPFNGYVFGLTLFCNYALPAIFNALIASWADGAKLLSPGEIPEWVFITWAGVLGVMAAGRNQLKKAREGVGSEGVLSSVIPSIFKGRQK